MFSLMSFLLGALTMALIACVVKMAEYRQRLASYEQLLAEMTAEEEAPALLLPFQQYRVYFN